MTVVIVVLFVAPVQLLSLFLPQATALSLATISGGSVSNMFIYTRRFHPNPLLTRPLIDYDASLLFAPPLLGGTMVRGKYRTLTQPLAPEFPAKRQREIVAVLL